MLRAATQKAGHRARRWNRMRSKSRVAETKHNPLPMLKAGSDSGPGSTFDNHSQCAPTLEQIEQPVHPRRGGVLHHAPAGEVDRHHAGSDDSVPEHKTEDRSRAEHAHVDDTYTPR